MKENSTIFVVKHERISTELIAGSSSLDENSIKTLMHNGISVCKERDSALWGAMMGLQGENKAYLPIMETEIEALLEVNYKQLKRINIEDLNIKDNIRLTKNILYQRMVRYFRNQRCPCRRGFTNGIEIYILEDDANPKYRKYQRYNLTIRYNDQVEDAWQLDVSMGRKSIVSKTQAFLLPALQNKQFQVIAGTMVMPCNEITQRHIELTEEQIFPICNPEIKGDLAVPTYYNRDTNKYLTKYNGIRKFIDRWINTPAFKEEVGVDFPDNANFIQLADHKIGIVDEKAKTLKFGNGQTGVSPGYFFKKYGAAERPAEHRHFFICPQSMKITLWRLYNIFQQGKDSSGRLAPNDVDTNNYLYHTIWMGNHAWADGMNLMFSDDEHALEALENHLKAMPFEHGKKYFAIIISDIDRDDTTSPHYHLYYKMKYLLMKYNIGSQVIHKKRVEDKNFISYMVPNIAAAIAGKEGGKAWKIAYPSQKNDMIIGIGAYKEYGMNQQYIGAAVCLDKEGELHNFDACLKGNFEELRSTIIKAILNFYKKFQQPSRLIIYYHKKLNHDESDMIEDALKKCQVSCPVIVINVTETDSEDLIAFDTTCPNVLMPVSGTYVHLRTKRGIHEYLLYNNERYAQYGERMGFLRPFPIKISIMAGRNNEQDLSEEDIKNIITLTYQTTRINWKSVSMRSMPITIAYAKLVAKFVPHFPDGQLTDFGKNNLWML